MTDGVKSLFVNLYKTLNTISSLSRDFLMVSIKLISACSVEGFERKPNLFVLIGLYLQGKE